MIEEKIEIEKGSGNIFKDLEIPHPDEYLAKARIALVIKGIIDENELKEQEAAKMLNLSQEELSALKEGLLDDFSFLQLFSLIRKLDCEIELLVRGKPTNNLGTEINISMPI